MCIRSFCVHYNPQFDTFQIFVFEVLIFIENMDMIPPGEYYDLSLGNYHPTEGITLVLVGIYLRKKLIWMKLENED